MSTYYCNKCGYRGEDAPFHKRPSDGKECGYLSRKTKELKPGSSEHLTLLMAPHHLNLISGTDRIDLLDYAAVVWVAAYQEGVKQVNGFDRLRGRWLFKERWHSVCSVHRVYDATCNACANGSWNNVILQSMSSFVYKHTPGIWRWWVNR